MTKHPTRDEMQQRMLAADRSHLGGELAFALARSHFPLALALQLIGCSRGTFYGWLRGANPTRAYVPILRRLIDQVEVALHHQQLPARTTALNLQALLSAKETIKKDPQYLNHVLNLRDRVQPVHYNSRPGSSLQQPLPATEIPNECDRISVEIMAPER